MAQANVTIIPFTGKSKEGFNQFEELLRGIIGVAGIAGPQANFLHLHLKDDALSFFQQLPVAVRADLDQSLAALRTRFVNNELQDIHVLKLENQKFDTKTDTPENFLVQLQALAKKAYPTPVIPAVAPIDAHAADAAVEAARFATETATNVTTLAEAETFKNNQIRRVFIKAMPGWLRSKLMDRPAIDTIHDLCTFASRQIAIRDMCRKDDYPEDGFNQIENPVSDTLITVNNIVYSGYTSTSLHSLLMHPRAYPLARSLCSLTGSFALLIRLSLILLLGFASPRFARV